MRKQQSISVNFRTARIVILLFGLYAFSAAKAQRFLISDTSNWVPKYKYDLNMTLYPTNTGFSLDSSGKKSLGYVIQLELYKSIKKHLFVGGGFANQYSKNDRLFVDQIASSMASYYLGVYMYILPKRYIVVGHNFAYANATYILESGYAYSNFFGSSFFVGLNFDKNKKYKKSKLDRFSIQIRTIYNFSYFSSFYKSNPDIKILYLKNEYFPNFIYVLTYKI